MILWEIEINWYKKLINFQVFEITSNFNNQIKIQSRKVGKPRN